MNYVLFVVAPIVLLMAYVGALAPYYISPPGKELSRFKVFYSYNELKALFLTLGSSFCGGVLFSTGIMHMIPDRIFV